MSLMTLSDLARELGISRQSMSKYHKAGALSGTLVGTSIAVEHDKAIHELEQAGFFSRRERGDKRATRHLCKA